MNAKGFNMMELLVVCIIVGILASIALVQLQGPKEDALSKEAKANLKLIAAAEKVYRLEVGGYVDAANEIEINSRLRLMLPKSQTNWKYNVTKPGGDSTFTATSLRSKTPPVKRFYINETMDDPDEL